MSLNFICIYVVYTLWKWPYILGYVTTWLPVLKKLQNGASKPHSLLYSEVIFFTGLMLPGVIPPENGGMDFTSLEKNQLCAVNVANNMYVKVCVCIRACMYMDVCMYVHMHACMLCAYACMHVMCICMYV